MKLIVANSNPILKELEVNLQQNFDILAIHNKEDLSIDLARKVNPEYIFFPHWSFIIPKEIFSEYQCIVFHMTDLPYGRGGSPLQNLIERGHKTTKISAIIASDGIDTGEVLLKKDLALYGSAEEIFIRAGQVIEQIIKDIILQKPKPQPQEGEITIFKRRKPHQSRIEDFDSLERLYDHIRMLDAEGYPKAFFETDKFRFEFSRAALKQDCIITDVRITKK